MKSWQGLLTLLVLSLSTTGCKTLRDTEALERELRYQEDIIYQLQDYIETYKCYLDECRRENKACRQKTGSRRQAASILDSKARGDDVELTPPSVELPDGVQTPKIQLPRVEQGSQNQLHTNFFAENTAFDRAIVSQWAYPLPEGIALARYQESILWDPAIPTPLAPGEQPIDPVIVSLPLEKGHAGGYLEETGAGGIWILLAPSNAAAQTVRPAGELSVALLDPKAYSEQKARVDNWKFSPQQLEMITEGLPQGKSLLLELPWSGNSPLHDLLHIYVRLITPEGNQLVVDQQVDLSQNQLMGLDGGEGTAAANRGWRKRTRSRNGAIRPEFPNISATSSSRSSEIPRDTAGKMLSGSKTTRKATNSNTQPVHRTPPEWKPDR